MDSMQQRINSLISSKKEDYCRAIEPLIKVKVDIYNMAIPEITILNSGELLSVDYKFTPEQQALLDQADAVIAYYQKIYLQNP